jgi:hypothetical protein
MKKIAVFALLVMVSISLFGCFFTANTSRVMSYDYSNIKKIKLHSSQHSSAVTLTTQDMQTVFMLAQNLQFVLSYSLQEDEFIEYEYLYVVKYRTGIFYQYESFVLNQGVFYNEYGKKTQNNLYANFISQTQQIFSERWAEKISQA